MILKCNKSKVIHMFRNEKTQVQWLEMRNTNKNTFHDLKKWLPEHHSSKDQLIREFQWDVSY